MPRKKTNLTMPVLALRGLMVFPHMVLHFDVGRPKSVAALQEAMMNDQKIFLVAQKDVDDPDPTPENLCTVGTIANIRQVMNLPGDNLRVLVEGETRRIDYCDAGRPVPAGTHPPAESDRAGG